MRLSTKAIDPVRKSRLVSLEPATAFELFTTRIESWWPLATHSINAEKAAGVRFEVRDQIAFITISRPHRGNALSPGMQAVFRRVWSEVRDNLAIRVAVIGAEGSRHFCTGFDVADAESEEAKDVFADRPLSEAVFWSPYQNRVLKPVICAVNGLCVGGGHHFVVDSDIVLASANAAFTDTHVNVGMVGALENIGLARRLPLGSAIIKRVNCSLALSALPSSQSSQALPIFKYSHSKASGVSWIRRTTFCLRVSSLPSP